ncbi:membrane-bound PQQ-dependent dehydrogenase, glucose/quinate/shikimate family [Caenibius sp. WL]|uniref:membrane-bound PQQ-dependent dehydrogenase, glucose/quinate/shikimate family n=1 Tax=Caenibius sp. WL TaxID=2872646 RepID=UPI001C99C3E9|nr:membrane-bound PQQ-dependent dehydrogenase, glucose/quinate/shikimate family [Caenibius sp. WL]QZP09267.1 membrane-bound PQQ-dependent dehydrogenase, glucose/quinate/shikimate family [Caenibius sp. WL]
MQEAATGQSRARFFHNIPLAALVLGAIFAAIGLILTIGGIWLAVVGGSLYYVLAGLGLLASAWFLLRGNRLGTWIYAAVYAATVVWALWESGANPWALIPRLVGPTVLLALLLLFAPLLDRHRTSWRNAGLGAAGAVGLLAVILIGAAALQPGGPRSPFPEELRMAAGNDAVGTDWPAWGGTQAGQRYSTLDQITPKNASKLTVAWTAHTGDLPSGAGVGKYAAETTPIKIGDRLYLCTARNILLALDAASGKEIWRYDPKVSDRAIPYSASCRGVTAYRRGDMSSATGTPGVQLASARAATPQAATPPLRSFGPTSLQPARACDLRIIEGTLDGRLIAVDAADGRPCADFGLNGQVDIKQGMGTVYPGMISITAPPVIVRGNIVTGHQVLDGQTRYAPSGVIQAFNAETGAFAWAWDMGRPGKTTPPEPGEQYTRGTPNMWTTASADEQLGLVYVPTGNAAVDYLSRHRTSQENEFSSSLVALDATTGRPVWRFQTVRMDVWDYDLGSQPTLVNLRDGTPAVILPSKQGEIFVLDRRTGQPLHGVKEAKAPTSGLEPDLRSPTQPHSQFNSLRQPNMAESDMWGMSPIDQMICRIQYRRSVYQGYYTPPQADRPWLQYPGYNGGSDWGSVAIDPVHGVIVANYNDMPNRNKLVPRKEADRRGWKPRGPDGNQGGNKAEGMGDPQADTPYAVNVNAGWRLGLTGLLCKQPPYGGIRAIDMLTGKTIWDRPFGSARANGPWGIGLGLPFSIGTPNNGGAVVTAGGLIFIAGTTDNLIRAIDIRTGETVWSDVLPGGGQANVMTYEQGGRQFVVVMAGGHHFMETPISDALVAYALPVKG